MGLADPGAIKLKFRVVRDGLPGMDGVYKTIHIGGPYDTYARAQKALETLSRWNRPGDNTRIQSCWTTEWEDVGDGQREGLHDVPAADRGPDPDRGVEA